eukprot:6939855-Pyramimonas_sp.AAC.1
MTSCWVRPGTGETCSKTGSWSGRRRPCCARVKQGIRLATPPVDEDASRSGSVANSERTSLCGHGCVSSQVR